MAQGFKLQSRHFVVALLLLHLCFTALRHILDHLERSQLTYTHCSWASLMGSLPVLSAHSFFASNCQLPFLNQREKLFHHRTPRKNVARREDQTTTVRIPGGPDLTKLLHPAPRHFVPTVPTLIGHF